MDEIDQLLQDLQNDRSDRHWIVSQLEEVADDRVVDVFVATLDHCQEDEQLRIEKEKGTRKKRKRGSFVFPTPPFTEHLNRIQSTCLLAETRSK